MAPKRSSRIHLLSLRVVVIFVLFALIWVPTTDALLENWADNTRELTRLQNIKAAVFMSLVALLLYALIVQALRSQHRVEHDLATERSRLDLVMEQLPASLWTTDRDLRITSSQGRGLEASGLKPGEIDGMMLHEYLGTSDPSFIPISAHHAALEGKEVSYSLDWLGNTFWTVISPLRADGGAIEGCLGLGVDVTKERAAAAELRITVDRLRRSNEQRDRLLRDLVQAEQKERDRIAQGIHDDSIQVMTSAGMALDVLLEREQDQHAAEILRRTRTSVGEAITRLRKLAFDLKPVELDKDGLGPALHLALERASAEAGFRFELDDRASRSIPPATRYLLYRVASEAITNVGKHAGARKVKVSLHEVDGGIELRVNDDGVGMRPGPSSEAHFGLSDMQARADAVAGRFRCSDLPEGGTSIEFWAPLTDNVSQTQ